MDFIAEDVVRLLVFGAMDPGGLFLVPVMRSDSKLYLGCDQFFAFENEKWEMSFFDGTK